MKPNNFTKNATPEQLRARCAKAGRAGAKRSPWNKGPVCKTQRAHKLWNENRPNTNPGDLP